jgi:hypothetical protein
LIVTGYKFVICLNFAQIIPKQTNKQTNNEQANKQKAPLKAYNK